MSAFVKIPLQVLVLLVGVFMFLFYVFNQPPMLFNTEHAAQGRAERARGRLPRARGGVHRPRTSAAAPRRRRWRQSRRPGARRGARRVPRRHGARCRRSGAARPRIVKDVTGVANYGDKTGDTPQAGRQLRVPDVRHDALAAGAGRADHRGDLRRGDVGHRRRAERHGDRHRDRRLQAPAEASPRATRTTCSSRDSPSPSGASSPASSRTWPCSSARSSRWSTASARSSTARCSASSCSRSPFKRANGHGAFVGLLSGIVFVVAFAFNPGDAERLVSLAQSARRRRS